MANYLLTALTRKLQDVNIPILGVLQMTPGNFKIDYAPETTEEQIAAGEAIREAFDWQNTPNPDEVIYNFELLCFGDPNVPPSFYLWYPLIEKYAAQMRIDILKGAWAQIKGSGMLNSAAITAIEAHAVTAKLEIV